MTKFFSLFLSFFLTISVTYADEIKINVPFAALHTQSHCGDRACNENLLDDGLTIGVSYTHDYIGVSYNTVADNSFGTGRSHYFTTDFTPKIYENDSFYIRAGGSIGFATGYNKLVDSDIIPFAGISTEVGIGNFSISAVMTPDYKQAPSSFNLLARYKMYEW